MVFNLSTISYLRWLTATLLFEIRILFVVAFAGNIFALYSPLSFLSFISKMLSFNFGVFIQFEKGRVPVPGNFRHRLRTSAPSFRFLLQFGWCWCQFSSWSTVSMFLSFPFAPRLILRRFIQSIFNWIVILFIE